AGALTAPIQRHHEARLLWRSPKTLDAEAERSMPASCHPHLFSDMRDLWLPDERAIREQLRGEAWRRASFDDPIDPLVILGIGVQHSARRYASVRHVSVYSGNMRRRQSQ